MKPKYNPLKPATGSTMSAVLVMSLAAAATVVAADVTWDGNTDSDGGDGVTFDSALNWSGDALPSLATPDTALFDGTVSGPLSLNYTGAMGGSPGNLGVNIGLAATQTDAVSIDSGAVTGALRLNNVSIASGAGAFTLGDGSDAFNITLGGATDQTHTWTNNSSSTATISSDVAFGLGGGGTHALHFSGSGDWQVNAAIAPTNAANLSLQKTGSGELILSGGGSLDGGLNAFGGSFRAVLKEGTTRITSGTYQANNGEFVVGGLDASAGTDTQLILDGGSLTGVSWMSVGRGNGDGTASSDVILNNDANLSSANLSMGFNAGNGATAPKGSITLNGSSTMSVSSGNFYVAESGGSNMTINVNDSAILSGGGEMRIGIGAGATGTLNGNGGTVNATGTVRVGYGSGTGFLNVNSGTVNAGSVDVAYGTAGSQTSTGTVTVSSGGTLNSEGDFRTGFAGAATSQATVTVDGGDLNVGSTAKRWMIVGQWDATNSTVNVDAGNLNLNANTDIRMKIGNNGGGTNIINLNGGAITSFSDNQTTANGSGVVDLMNSGTTSTNNSFNLNGGVLTIREVVTTNNGGTAAFNFNGGTLKATGDTANFVNLGGASQSANVLVGGAVIDSNGYNVTIVDGLQSTGGDGGLTKLGDGTLTLAGTNTYDGATTVVSGALVVNGSLANSSTTIGSGATLGGSGAISGATTIAAGGTLSAGNSPGVMTFGSTLTLEGTTLFEIGGMVRGTEYDGIDVGGLLTYGGALDIVAYDLGGGLYDLTQAAAFDLFGIGSGTAGDFASVTVGGNALTLDSGVWSGVDSGNSNVTYTFDQATGDLTVAVIPEPSAVLLGGLGMLALLRRRR